MATNNDNLRILWLIRHAEREDNINSNWMKNANPNGLKVDNSPLSKRGKTQAAELAQRFSSIQIDHLIASPFERTMETASILVGNRNIPVKPEPGFMEPLYKCKQSPSFADTPALKTRFPLADLTYDSIYKKPFPNEPKEEDVCKKRVEKTLVHVLARYNSAKSIVIVSHGSIIAAIHKMLVNKRNYVGQATVSKFVEQNGGKFKLEFTSDASHLSDKKNLRGW